MMTRSHKTRLQINKIRETNQFKELVSRYDGATWIDRQVNWLTHKKHTFNDTISIILS